MTSWRFRVAAVVAAVAGIVVAAALGGDAADPYVITAIDYHFHDAHPTFPIAPGRDLVIRDQGRNVHNVTIPALDYSRDVEPGQRLVIEDVASRFEGAGRYSLFCVYHQDRGMTGVIVIADG